MKPVFFLQEKIGSATEAERRAVVFFFGWRWGLRKSSHLKYSPAVYGDSRKQDVFVTCRRGLVKGCSPPDYKLSSHPPLEWCPPDGIRVSTKGRNTIQNLGVNKGKG